MESRSDEQLLADHLAGTPGAFDDLVARYVNEVFGFLCRFVGNAAAADDLAQETFVQVHLAAAAFDPKRVFRPWLYTIAANKARDFLRARGRRQEFSLDSAGRKDDGPSLAQSLPAAEAEFGQEVEGSEKAAAVRAIVNEMPEHLRMMLVLGYFQQLPYANIAEILDVPVGTVKSRLHAAVKHFAKQWQASAETKSASKG